MLRTNIIGGVIIIAFVMGIIAYGISLRIELDWGFYFKILGSVGLVALIISVITHIIPSGDKT